MTDELRHMAPLFVSWLVGAVTVSGQVPRGQPKVRSGV
jgi:hypothetical protein